ncbi:pyridoxal-phosphate dependent enzyme [Corynebacterium sp. 335C]
MSYLVSRTGIRGLVGGTPLVRLDRLASPDPSGNRPPSTPRHRIWAKLEGLNPGGSAKDRTAAALLDAALASGAVARGGRVVESSSGNLGVALARECGVHGIDFHCVVDPRSNEQTVAAIQALGATVHLVDAPDPETGDWLTARRALVAQLLTEMPDAVTLDQYSNRAAFAAHRETMREVVEQVGRAPDRLLVAVSTTGTLGGCVRHLRDIGATTHVTAVDAEGSVLYGGDRGERLLPGFGAGMVPELSTLTDADRVVRVGVAPAAAAARVLARREGILAGASGGAVVAALLDSLCSGGTAEADVGFGDRDGGTDTVLILHDLGNAYLDTIHDDDWVRERVGAAANEKEDEWAHLWTP